MFLLHLSTSQPLSFLQPPPGSPSVREQSGVPLGSAAREGGLHHLQEPGEELLGPHTAQSRRWGICSLGMGQNCCPVQQWTGFYAKSLQIAFLQVCSCWTPVHGQKLVLVVGPHVLTGHRESCFVLSTFHTTCL